RGSPQRGFDASATGWSPIQPVGRGGPHMPWDEWTPRRRQRFFRTAGLGLGAFILLIIVAVRCGSAEEPGVITDGATTTTTARAQSTAPSRLVTAATHPASLPGATYQGPAAVVGQTIVMMGGI